LKIHLLGTGKYVTLQYSDFEVEYNQTADCSSTDCNICPYDYVAIHDGSTNAAPTLR